MLKRSGTSKKPKELPPDQALDHVKKELKKTKVQINILKKIIEIKNQPLNSNKS